jgi:hypothetical protein
MPRQFLLNIDPQTGRYLALELPAYIQRQYLPEGEGVYSRAELSQTRSSTTAATGNTVCNSVLRKVACAGAFSTHAYNLDAAFRPSQPL